jgi:hypothetical protein
VYASVAKPMQAGNAVTLTPLPELAVMFSMSFAQDVEPPPVELVDEPVVADVLLVDCVLEVDPVLVPVEGPPELGPVAPLAPSPEPPSPASDSEEPLQPATATIARKETKGRESRR